MPADLNSHGRNMDSAEDSRCIGICNTVREDYAASFPQATSILLARGVVIERHSWNRGVGRKVNFISTSCGNTASFLE